MQFSNSKIVYKSTGDKNNLIFFSRGKLKGETRMSMNSVNYLGTDYAAEFSKKWEAQNAENKEKLANLGVTVPVGQSTENKPKPMTGLEVEKSDVSVEHVDRQLTSNEAIENAEAEAKKAFQKYGTENGQKVNAQDAEKMAEKYVENEQHKETVQSTNVFMDKNAYKAAERERKENYKDMYNEYREQGYTRKEAKKRANAQLAENTYISGRKTRKFIENNRDYFYDENGDFSSDKFKQKVVEYANINTKPDETLNYHLSLKERRAAANQEGISATMVKHMAKKANVDYEKDNTNLYRGSFLGTTAAIGFGIGSAVPLASSAAAAASSGSSAAATAGGASAAGSASAAAAASASAVVNGGAVGLGTGLAVGTAGAGFLSDGGEIEDRVYAPGKPQDQKTNIDLIPPKATKDRPFTPAQTPIIEQPQEQACPLTPLDETKTEKVQMDICNYTPKRRGESWHDVIAAKYGIKEGTRTMYRAIGELKRQHGIKDRRKNVQPKTFHLPEMLLGYKRNCDAKVGVTSNKIGKVEKYNGQYTAPQIEVTTTYHYIKDCNNNISKAYNSAQERDAALAAMRARN